MSVSDRELEKINNKLNRLAETVENNKNTTNTIYKLVEKQDYNSERSRHWLPVLLILTLGWLVAQEHITSTWEQIFVSLPVLFYFWGYFHFSRD